MPVAVNMPDDVIVLHDALQKIREIYGVPDVNTKGLQWGERSARRSAILSDEVASRASLSISVKNCGTALRFLQVHLEQCYPGEPITLTGDPRLMERKGKPTSQLDSARILHGLDVPVEKNESPYITMSRKIYQSYIVNRQIVNETDWSSASYWYEYVAIHGGELLLEGLKRETLQGDKEVAKIYSTYFGVLTSFMPDGVKIAKSSFPLKYDRVKIDFENIPDLYPSIAYTCERLGIALEATGTERLKYKESDRLEAVRLHEVRNDHRMAMALLCADFPVTKEEQACVAKSYPDFVEQLHNVQKDNLKGTIAHVTPIKGVNDDNKGKKYALSKLIHAATSEYVWMHDDDVTLPKAANVQSDDVRCTKDLVILPLRMESVSEHPSLLEKLQIAEYAAIQELTMRSAKGNQAVMCSGANLIVKRDVWLECESELHPEIPSGDDMFLLEAVKRRGYKVGVIDEEDYTAIVRPITSWKAFFRQRMRWAGKAPKYTDRDILRCGRIVVAANILQFLCPPLILIKFPIEYSLIKSRENTEYRVQSTETAKPRTPWYVALLLEILYPIYLLISLIGGLFRKEW